MMMNQIKKVLEYEVTSYLDSLGMRIQKRINYSSSNTTSYNRNRFCRVAGNKETIVPQGGRRIDLNFLSNIEQILAIIY